MWHGAISDEIIVSANTIISIWLAVAYAGAIMVLIKSVVRTYKTDTECLETGFTPKTRAILHVQLYSQPATRWSILAVAERLGLKVIGDAAQLHGARYLGQRVGNLCATTSWSFYPGRNWGTQGDAGVVTTGDDFLIIRLSQVRCL